MELVNNLFSILFNRLIQDVLFGIGKIKFVQNALKDGISINKVSVLKLTISARPLLKEDVLNVSKDIDQAILTNAQLTLEFNKFQTQVVLFGTGIIKFVWNALKDGTSELTEDAYQLMISVNPILMAFVLNATKDMI